MELRAVGDGAGGLLRRNRGGGVCGGGDGWAGYFAGDARVTGDLEVGTENPGGFRSRLTVYADTHYNGIYSEVTTSDLARSAFYGIASGDSDFSSYGVFGDSNSATSDNYGVYGRTWFPSSGDNYGIYGHATNSGSGGAYAGYFSGDIHVTGDITYDGSIYNPSDIRLKENIAPLENAGEKISSLKAVYFNYKDKSPSDREIGVIAQDVEKVLPELVSTNSDGYMAVDYTKLAPVLIEAVKDLMAENKQLKQRLDVMEKKLSDRHN